MNQISSYSGLATKIRAMQSRLLTRSQLFELAGCSSIADAAAYLKQQPGYNQTLESLDETSLHRSAIEQYLKKSIWRDFSRIYRFCNLKQRQFLELYVIRYEIAFLKLCLRTVYDENVISIADEDAAWFYQRYFSFDIAKLNGTSMLGRLIDALRGSEYYSILSGIYDNAGQRTTLFDYEMALDLYYFGSTWKSIHKQFSGKEKNALLEAYGSKMDMLNIQWIYRLKKYYKMSAADIFDSLIPVYYRLKRETIVSMTEAENLDSLAELIRSTRYGEQFSEDSPSELERRYHAALHAIHRASVRKYPYSILCVDSHLYEKEQETDLITTIVEGIRYGLSHEEIARYITYT